MSLFPFIHWSAFIFYALSTIFIASRKGLSRVKIFGALLFSAFAIWSLAIAVSYSAEYFREAIFWHNVSSLGWIAFPSLSLLFYLEFTQHTRLSRNRIFLTLVLLPVLLFGVLQWSGLLLNNVAYHALGWQGVWQLTPLSALFFVYYLSMNIASIALCIHMGLRADSPRKEKQAWLLVFTGGSALLVSSITDVILPLLNIDIVPHIADIFIVIWGIGVILAITRYGLLGLTPSTAAGAIIDTMTESLILIDKEKKIALMNEAARKVFSGTVGLIGRPFSELVVESEKADAFLEAALKPGQKSKIDLTFKVSDGMNIPMDISASVVGDKMEPVLGLVIVGRDMSARIRNEREIQEQTNLIDEILETVPNAVLAIDSRMRIIRANRAFLEMMQLSDVKDKGIDSVFASAEFLKNAGNILRNSCESCSFQLRHRIGKAEKLLDVSIIKMGQERIMVTLNDVTAEHEKQEKLYLADRLATVGEMASGVAHELNNPLTSVIALSRMLLDQDLPAEVHEDIGYICSEAQRAAIIVKDMLTFARKHAAVLQMTPVNKILEDVIKLRAYEHKINNIVVNTDFDQALPEIKANYFQIQQVFLNVILNAESAISVNKSDERYLNITTSLENDFVRILFVDNGPGIHPENIDRVFDPFFTTKEVGKGTGLGLSICYGIVNAHQGRIYASSEPGRGAAFVIELPLNRVTDSNDESEVFFPPRLEPSSVLTAGRQADIISQ